MSFTHLPAQCPSCRSILRVRRELIGQPVCCVYCNHVFEPGRRAESAGPSPTNADGTAASKPVWLLGANRPAEAPLGPRSTPRPAPAPAPASTPTPAPNPPEAAPTPPNVPTMEEVLALRAELDRARAETDALAARLKVAREEANRLRETLALEREAARAEAATRSLPVLVRDLQRWSSLAAEDVRPRVVAVAVAVAVGPPPLPPSLDDLTAVERHTDLLRSLLRMPLANGKPFHTLFDPERFQAFQAKLRESALLADRLVNNVERSRNQKEVMWHLMVAQRTDELNRKRK